MTKNKISSKDDLIQVLETQDLGRMRQATIKIIIAPAFDYTMGLIILLNVVLMVIETNATAEEEDSGGSLPSWVEACGWVALTIFILELLLRLYALRSMFFHERWNIADAIVVTTDAAFSLIGLVVGDTFPISMLRIFRLAKLARISKLFRVFPELRVLMAGLTGSARAIFWGMVLLIFVLLVWAMCAVLFIHPLAKNLDFDGCTRCPHAYDSVGRAMLTFWQQIVTGDSWGAATIPVIEAYPSTTMFFIPMFMMVGMAVMNLILGVVVEVALTAKAQIEEEDRTEVKIERMETKTHLMELCQRSMQVSEGEVSKEEAFQKFQSPGDFRDSILALDVTEEDFDIIWTIIDADKRGKVQYKDLITRLYAVRSSDTQFMLSYIKYYITMIRNDILETMNMLDRQIVDGMHEVTQEVEKEVQRFDKDLQEFEKQAGHEVHNIEHDLREREAMQEQKRTAVGRQLQLCEPHIEVWEGLEQNVLTNTTLENQEWRVPERSQELTQANQTVNSCCGERSGNRLPMQESVRKSSSALSTDSILAEGVTASTQGTGAGADRNTQLSREIDSLQLELKHVMTNLIQSIQSQVALVSTMNLKVSMNASTPSVVII